MITRDECGPNFVAFVLRLRENPGKNLNQETDPTRCVRSNDVTPRPQRWAITHLQQSTDAMNGRCDSFGTFPMINSI